MKMNATITVTKYLQDYTIYNKSGKMHSTLEYFINVFLEI